ncbi:LysM peptidoglycan-binding domain-containing protein [Thiospirochaeta perfilievii]|uniref:LysM peptidoglycan-binding domain-containing protein n=1 Tax=Thiospirochaeta perfilievii TaxID=252967 RepID=A0A5C1QDL6_9SPIO|nr:M23 family metallopeptidase [Thiospirochaeta perfilievii]QEN06163.1 LysM peptidoglycan-binding domain-containing protein [Thiospirochaeta perfilievii]
MVLKNKIFLILLTLINSITLFSYPEISTRNSDILFKQVVADIKENNKRILLRKKIVQPQFYKYIIKNGDTIFSIASRFNISYDSIATLNSLENKLFFPSLKFVYIPTCPGIYTEKIFKDSNIVEVNFNNKNIKLYPGRGFSATERLNFLVTPFKSPLNSPIITSEFGNRENPYTGNTEFHSGLDFRASIGTKVLSPYDGEINNIGYSEFYGNYLIIKHPNGYSSHYYHLNRVILKVGDKLKKGDLVATTGNSGKSTGPHLHFEIHLNEEPINPRLLLGEV